MWYSGAVINSRVFRLHILSIQGYGSAGGVEFNTELATQGILAVIAPRVSHPDPFQSFPSRLPDPRSVPAIQTIRHLTGNVQHLTGLQSQRRRLGQLLALDACGGTRMLDVEGEESKVACAAVIIARILLETAASNTSATTRNMVAAEDCPDGSVSPARASLQVL